MISIYFFYLPSTSSHLHQLYVGNCDSNSRLVVDEEDKGKFGLERVDTSIKYYKVRSDFQKTVHIVLDIVEFFKCFEVIKTTAFQYNFYAIIYNVGKKITDILLIININFLISDLFL